VKVLFIYPNLRAQIGFNYGVAFLSAVLKEAGHSTSLINVNDELSVVPGDDELLTRVNAERPGLIGFSVVTVQYHYAVDMAKKIRRAFPHVPLVIGGIHATMDPEGCLADGPFDYACVGEGEEALLELVNAIENGADTTGIANIWAKAHGVIHRNPVRPFQALAKLPPKDYEIFDFQKMIDAKDGWVGLMASRGCPFRCSYCFNHKIVEKYRNETGLTGRELNYIRHHTVDAVIEEIEYLLAHYRNIKWFIFDDDLFTFDKAYVADFAAKYAKVTGLPFVCNAHVKFFDAETAALLARSGCRIVKFGVESGSERVRREVMHRQMTNEEIEEAFAAANAAGLHTSAFVMMGLPTETEREMDETVKLLARSIPMPMTCRSRKDT
jgi:anaerobic magnesium-protoporphyrin IX monomethyl ester cyclase